jgi:large-conductance mechanosensitive channel
MIFLKIAFAIFKMIYSVRKITKSSQKTSKSKSQYSGQTGAGRIIELDKDQYKID